MSLIDYGFNEDHKRFLETRDSRYSLARVISQSHTLYRLATEEGEYRGQVSGNFCHQARERADYPVVGDWVLCLLDGDNAHILELMPRKSQFSRNSAGKRTEQQVVAANVDTLFIVSSLNQDFNLRRIERYVLLAWESGATPVVILNKVDLCDHPEVCLREVRDIAGGVQAFAVSAHTSEGLEALRAFLQPGQTAALLGSSGVGKSSLVNRLAGSSLQAVQEILQSTGRGKHTTTHRELHLIEGGGLLLDTPGMRELQLWEGEEGLQEVFQDIHTLAQECRFKDCHHENEPGCAIRAAIQQGTLSLERMSSFRKLERELRYHAGKVDERIAFEEKERIKKLSKAIKRLSK